MCNDEAAAVYVDLIPIYTVILFSFGSTSLL